MTKQNHFTVHHLFGKPFDNSKEYVMQFIARIPFLQYPSNLIKHVQEQKEKQNFHKIVTSYGSIIW